MDTYIIAEAGVNHNGSFEMAINLVKEAKKAGADAVKFQTFKAENLASKFAKKADYQQKNTSNNDSQLQMLSKLELSHEEHYELYNLSKEIEIDFLSTAFDQESLDYLNKQLNLEKLKISSVDLTNAPLLYEFGKTQKDIILSTGMSDFDEIKDALGVIAYGFLDLKEPSRVNFAKAFNSKDAQDILKRKVTLLHCTTEYPAPLEEINLRAMRALKDKFNLRIGYSDHSEGILVSIIAASNGAQVIEKHFTLDKQSEGPDHSSSLDPNELKEMVTSIRNIEVILGDKTKKPTKSELKNKIVARKSLVASKDIQIGQKFSFENITVKRPGSGKSPIEYWDLLGEVSEKSYLVDEVID